MKLNDCQVVASCNIDKHHLKRSMDAVNGHYKNKDCKPYHDYREMMARKDIDAVMIAVPDHWHELIAVEAAKQGKDIYGEKPLAKTIVEQQAIVKAVTKHGRIWQTGSWQRSWTNFHKAAEIVRNGLIGKITRVEVDTSHFKGNFPEGCSLEVCTAPHGLIDPSALGALPWQEILTRTKLQADSRHVYEKELQDTGEISHARFHIYPDGGVARLRIFGTLAKRVP